MDSENNGALAGWFVGGLALGAAATLLLAPQWGARTRRQLQNTAEQGKRSLLASSQEIVSRGRELYERGREIAEETADLFERGRSVAEKTIDERL